MLSPPAEQPQQFDDLLVVQQPKLPPSVSNRVSMDKHRLRYHVGQDGLLRFS